MDGYRANTHFTTGTVNAKGDLAAVSDQDFFKHPLLFFQFSRAAFSGMRVIR
jgi:hypothetical protein